jgi:hypothetical protein
MDARLPTITELAKLPMRAIIAYAARTARRVSQRFRGIVADDTLDTSLQLIDAVTTTPAIRDLDQVSVIRAAEGVVAAYEAAPAHLQSGEKDLLVFSLVQAALAATNVIEAALDPGKAGYHMLRAARESQLAVDPIRRLGGGAAREAINAAREDYDRLLREYGEHDQVVIGDPVHCFHDA